MRKSWNFCGDRRAVGGSRGQFKGTRGVKALVSDVISYAVFSLWFWNELTATVPPIGLEVHCHNY